MILGLPDPPPQTLSDWLQIATRALADASKERIRPEMEAHYAQAVEAHIENGMSESDARAAALAELGDARAVGKRFRRQYLTESDTDRLKTWGTQARSIRFVVFRCFQCVFYATYPFFLFRGYGLASYRSLPLYFAGVFFVMVAPLAACFMVARYSGVGRIRSLIFMRALSSVAFWVFIFSPYVIDPRFKAAALILKCFVVTSFLAALSIDLLPPLRLWIKLTRMGATTPGEVS